MKGRKPDPRPMRVLKGNAQRRSMPPEAPPPVDTTLPAAPAWLSEDARAEWDLVVPQLRDRGYLERADTSTLATYCELVAEVAALTRILEREGRFYSPKQGGLKREHPAAKARRETMMRQSTYAALFGLSPADRRRVPEAKKPGKNRLEAIVGGRA